MAKVSYTKLGLKNNQDVKILDFNEQKIEVKQYLPVNDKLKLIENAINNMDANNFTNPIKISVFTMLEIIYFYTNINFTEKQKDEPEKLYDALVSSGFAAQVLDLIPDDEYEYVVKGVKDTIDSLYAYANSARGIIEAIGQDYSNVAFDAEELKKKISDPDNLELLKSVIAKLG